MSGKDATQVGWVLMAGWMLVVLLSCTSDRVDEVVVYTALDEEFSRPVFDRFTEKTGIRVKAKFDTESTKTVGLTRAILAERARPRCDVFWNNEIVNTLRLEQAGLLARYDSPSGRTFPKEFRSPEARWHGFAARARVLIVNTRLVPPDRRPSSIHDLVDPHWRGKVGVAKPLAGTTASHVAVLYALWGDVRAQGFLQRLKQNARILSGNRQVAREVGAGRLAFGLTDTDDAIIEKEHGHPVEIVYPDQADGQPGTLFLPNTVALLDGAANAPEGRRLIDFLLSPEVEQMLADGSSAQIPLNPASAHNPRVESPTTIRAMQVDYQKGVEAWEQAAVFLRQEFASAD
jgi:iron(III) transport system substrate-binding protein